jgi:exodeoxyribonuclease X
MSQRTAAAFPQLSRATIRRRMKDIAVVSHQPLAGQIAWSAAKHSQTASHIAFSASVAALALRAFTSGSGIANAMHTLVRPGKPIPPGASAIHHLIDEDAQSAPQLAEVIDRFKGADFHVAHNCAFGQSFFSAQGVELGPWICTYKCALRVWPELEGHGNQELRYALGRATPCPGFDRSTISPHRAAFDIVVSAAIFEELIKHARWSELVQWSSEPPLHTRIHFGKYRGRRYDDIAATDPDYLQWIIEKSELDEGVKHSHAALAGSCSRYVTVATYEDRSKPDTQNFRQST